MPLTYTEIEERKSFNIYIFFCVVILFYFLIAFILGVVFKMFFVQKSALAPHSFPLNLSDIFNILMISVVAAALHIVYSVWNSFKFVGDNLGFQAIDPEDAYHARFAKIVDDVNVATGSKYRITPVVIPTYALNAFAMTDFGRKAIIGVTEGLLSKLNRNQIESVVAHEMAHIASGDSLQDTVGCALFGIYAAMLAGLRKVVGPGRKGGTGQKGGNLALFLITVYFILIIAQFFYNVIRLFISRQKEYRADAIAVRMTRNPVSLAEALERISAGWKGLGYIDRNLETIFIMNPAGEAVDEKEGFAADLFSTHPPVASRVKVLAEMAHASIDDIRRSASVLDPARPAPLSGRPGGKENSTCHKCPKCDKVMSNEEYEGLVLERCASCGGVLVKDGAMDRITLRQEKKIDSRVARLAGIAVQDGKDRMLCREASSAGSPLRCPKCGEQMVRGAYTMAYPVEVDRCVFCGVTFFDKDELEIVQYLIENKVH